MAPARLVYKKGDLLECGADILVQQTNCLSVRPHGLSATISREMRLCPYAERIGLSSQPTVSRKADRGVPGTALLMRRYNLQSESEVVVACLMGQFTPGTPGKYYHRQCREHGVEDDAAQRLEWFRQALRHLTVQLKFMPTVRTIAFPYRIGCGLAGGDWALYECELERWASQPQHRTHSVWVIQLQQP